MRVIFNGVKAELKNNVSESEKKFLERMEKRGFILTYYPQQDTHAKEGTSIKDVSIELKSLKNVKL